MSPIVQWSCSNTGKEERIWIPWTVILNTKVSFYTDHSAWVWEAAGEPASNKKGQGKDVLPVADALQNPKMSSCNQKFIFILTYGKFIIHFNSLSFSKAETPWVAAKQCLEKADSFIRCLPAPPDTRAPFCADQGCSRETHTGKGKEQPAQAAFQWLCSTALPWGRTPTAETFEMENTSQVIIIIYANSQNASTTRSLLLRTLQAKWNSRHSEDWVTGTVALPSHGWHISYEQQLFLQHRISRHK